MRLARKAHFLSLSTAISLVKTDFDLNIAFLSTYFPNLIPFNVPMFSTSVSLRLDEKTVAPWPQENRGSGVHVGNGGPEADGRLGTQISGVTLTDC